MTDYDRMGDDTREKLVALYHAINDIRDKLHPEEEGEVVVFHQAIVRVVRDAAEAGRIKGGD